jgi:hypothetical protein
VEDVIEDRRDAITDQVEGYRSNERRAAYLYVGSPCPDADDATPDMGPDRILRAQRAPYHTGFNMSRRRYALDSSQI